MDPAPLVQSAKEAYEKALLLLNDMTGWNKLNEINGVVGYAKDSDGTDFRTYKADFYMNRPPKEVSRYIYDNYPALNEELNPEDMEYYREKMKLNENMKINEICIGPKGPVFGREITSVSIYLELGEDTYAEVSTSIEPLKSVRSGYVNAWLYFVLTLYEPVVDDTSRTHVSAVILSDPGGHVPAIIGNAVLANRTKFYALLKNRVETSI